MKRSITVLALTAALALTGCSPTVPKDAAAPVVTTAVDVATSDAPVLTPEATGIQTSGSYAADVTDLGVKPDDMADYAGYMKERICDQDRIGLGVSVRRIGASDVASGGGPEVVRLTVAYFCPEKSQEVEAALDYFN